MILASFRPSELAEALRWSAAGGLALHLRPKAGERLTCWEAGTRHGPDRGDLYGCDPVALRETCQSVWVNRVAFKLPGTPRQHVTLAGLPLPRLISRSWGATVAIRGFDRYEAVGRLWAGLARKRPVRTSLAEIREPGRGWVGPTPGWYATRPGWAWYATLPAGDLSWEHGVVGWEAVGRMSFDGGRVLTDEPLIRQRLGTPGGTTLTAVACRVQPPLFSLLGRCAAKGVGLTGGECGWVSRAVLPSATHREFVDHLRRWGMTPTAQDYRSAGYD